MSNEKIRTSVRSAHHKENVKNISGLNEMTLKSLVEILLIGSTILQCGNCFRKTDFGSKATALKNDLRDIFRKFVSTHVM